MVGLQFIGGKYVNPIVGGCDLVSSAILAAKELENLVGFLRATNDASSDARRTDWNLGCTTLDCIVLLGFLSIIKQFIYA